MPKREHDPRKLTLGQLLSQVCRLTGDRPRVRIEEIGLHKGQGFILFHLWHHDGIAQNVIAHALHVSPATVTNTLKRMERDGWNSGDAYHNSSRVPGVYHWILYGDGSAPVDVDYLRRGFDSWGPQSFCGSEMSGQKP